jgi:uncharacterized membrane protein YGL010W|tara:strand:+ start:850 stop:1326 length:477 start_codon:yes stop_codon:yes gene_type:complete
MNSIQEWLDAYSVSHKNKINKIIHWFCVPLIMVSLLGLLSLIKFSIEFNNNIYCISIAHILVVLALFFYLRLSLSISLGMFIVSFIFLFIIYQFELLFSNSNQLTIFYTSIFIVSWIGQFIGHKIEGVKPSFFEDIQFLLIGPAWLLSFIYNKFGIKY